MEKITLTLEEREAKTPNQLRREGKIPATIYGRGETSHSGKVTEKDFGKLPSAAYSHVIELRGGTLGKVGVLIRHVQRRATTHEILNIEFYRVKQDRNLTVQVRIKLIGASPAVQLGGQLLEVHQEVEIECLPKDIPDFVEVNLALLTEIDQGIHFNELTLSDQVKVLNPPDDVVVRVVAPRAAQAEEKPAAAAVEAEPAEAPAS